jgi:hypothetical protein
MPANSRWDLIQRLKGYCAFVQPFFLCKCITHYEREFLAFVIRHAMRMSNGHLWPARLYSIFSHYLIKGMIFENKVFEYKCVLSCLQLLSETYVILRRI